MDISALELFAECSEDEVARAVAGLERVEVAAGDTLMRAGERGTFFLLVLEGEATVFSPDADTATLGAAHPGSVVGELALLRDAPRSATVVATTSMVCLRGDADGFARLLEAPGVRRRFAHAVARRLATHARPVATALRDGTAVQVRPVLPTDRDLFLAGLERLSPESWRRRFFSPGGLTEQLLRYLVDIDYVDHFAWAVLAPDAAGAPGVGAARLVRSRTDRDTAEIALAVTDDWQGRGVGSLLLGALAAAAVPSGIRWFRADVLADNVPMLTLLGRAGARWERGEPGAVTTRVLAHDLATFVPDDLAGELTATARDVVSAAGLALV